MAFWNRPSRDELYEKALAEKQRLIETLAEQIDYLRAQLGRPSWSSPSQSVTGPAIPADYPGLAAVPDLPPMASAQMFTREEEQDLQHLLETGQIEPSEAASALAVIQAQNALVTDYDPS